MRDIIRYLQKNHLGGYDESKMVDQLEFAFKLPVEVANMVLINTLSLRV